MNAQCCFTTKDQQAGYPETRKALAGETTEYLIREYKTEMRHGFNSMFGHNSRRFSNLIADELLGRGITEIPNIFGPIPVKRWTY